jgi:hypothetical protein
MRVDGRVFLGVALISVDLGFLAFDSFDVPSEAEVRRTSVGIVFTGAFEWVDAGLRLLKAGAIPRTQAAISNCRCSIPTMTSAAFCRSMFTTPSAAAPVAVILRPGKTPSGLEVRAGSSAVGW